MREFFNMSRTEFTKGQPNKEACIKTHRLLFLRISGRIPRKCFEIENTISKVTFTNPKVFSTPMNWPIEIHSSNPTGAHLSWNSANQKLISFKYNHKKFSIIRSLQFHLVSNKHNGQYINLIMWLYAELYVHRNSEKKNIFSVNFMTFTIRWSLYLLSSQFIFVIIPRKRNRVEDT